MIQDINSLQNSAEIDDDNLCWARGGVEREGGGG